MTTKIKTGKPPVFTGKASELTPWLTHLQLDFRLQKITETEEKILYAASWPGGDPNLWFPGILDDYFDSAEDERRPVTSGIFDEDEGWVNFESEITRMYGERDEQKQAEERLERLTQTSSTASYLSAFNWDRYRVNWDESALKHRFYKGLKSTVKDELCKLDRYAYDFDDYANEAIKIDSRLYERKMEDRGHYAKPRYTLPTKANQSKKIVHKSTSYGHHPGPMDIGMVQKNTPPWKNHASWGGECTSFDDCVHLECSVHQLAKVRSWHRAKDEEKQHLQRLQEYRGKALVKKQNRRVYKKVFQELCEIEPFPVDWKLKSDTQGVTLQTLRIHEQHPRTRLGNELGPSQAAENQ